MSKSGLKIADEARDVSERMEDGVFTSGADTSTVAQGGMAAPSMPRKFEARDRYDDIMEQKMKLMDNEGMTPFGQVYYDDKVGRWLEKKQAAVETANLDAWFGKQYNKASLAERQFAQQIYPEYYAERERLMMERAQMVVKIKSILLRGPRTPEDLHIQYLLNTGRIQLPPDWDRIGASSLTAEVPDQAAQQARFTRQLVRLPRFLVPSQREANANSGTGRAVGGNPTLANQQRFGQWEAGVEASKNQPFSTGPAGTLPSSTIGALKGITGV